jgi:hypothetical protein
MNRILKAASFLVLTLLLSLPGSYAQADTTTSGGQAIVPPFHLHYITVNERLNFHMQIANISGNSVHAVIKYHDQTGAITKTVEQDIVAGAIFDTEFDTSGTPGSSMVPFYATIDWTGPYSGQKPLVAHAYVRYFVQTSDTRAQDTNSLPINGGMPF